MSLFNKLNYYNHHNQLNKKKKKNDNALMILDHIKEFSQNVLQQIDKIFKQLPTNSMATNDIKNKNKEDIIDKLNNSNLTINVNKNEEKEDIININNNLKYILNKPLSVQEAEKLKAFNSEYLKIFVIFGYDMSGERIVLSNCNKTEDKDAIFLMSQQIPLFLSHIFMGSNNNKQNGNIEIN